MILPIAVYFARTGRRLWWGGAVLIVLGALASGSRTGVVMLVAEIIVFLRLKPDETKRLWPVLVPAVVVIHVFLPGQIGASRTLSSPKAGSSPREHGSPRTRTHSLREVASGS